MFEPSTQNIVRHGVLALEYGGERLKLQVLQSGAGFYLGTLSGGMPNSRESVEYFATREKAEFALESGDWTQKEYL